MFLVLFWVVGIARRWPQENTECATKHHPHRDLPLVPCHLAWMLGKSMVGRKGKLLRFLKITMLKGKVEADRAQDRLSTSVRVSPALEILGQEKLWKGKCAWNSYEVSKRS